MSDAITVALITGGITLIGVILTQVFSTKTMYSDFKQKSELQNLELRKDLEKMQAVQNGKIEDLTAEVRKHNNFAEKIPVIEEQIKVANHRIEDLERMGVR